MAIPLLSAPSEPTSIMVSSMTAKERRALNIDDWFIHRAAKMRKMLQFYNKLVGHFTHQTGSHMQGTSHATGDHTTVAYHGGGRNITPGARKNLSKHFEAAKQALEKKL